MMSKCPRTALAFVTFAIISLNIGVGRRPASFSCHRQKHEIDSRCFSRSKRLCWLHSTSIKNSAIRRSTEKAASSTVTLVSTPLWTLKVTQMLIFAANVCLGRYITVYYDHIGLSRQLMGMLLVVMPLTAFFGGLFWSSVVDSSGAYKKILIGTSTLGTAVVFSYLLPAVCKSLPLLLCTTVLHGFLASPSGPIVDGLCLKVLAEQKVSDEAYGDQRLWAAVGWGGMALIAGKLVDAFGVSSMFFSYALLVLINVIVIARWMPNDRSPPLSRKTEETNTGESQQTWLKTLTSFKALWMLSNLLVYGILISLVETFLGVFIMQDFKAPSKLLLGASTAVMCVFEIPIFKVIGRFWADGKEESLIKVIVASEVALALRCLLYAVIPRDHPWLLLFVEPLHGFNFAAMWCAVVEFARRLAPSGGVTRMQALISGLYFNISFAAGSLIWGFLVARPPQGLGFTKCFYLDALLIVVWLLVWRGSWEVAKQKGWT